MENLNQMVASVASGDFGGFQQAFETEMAARVQSAVEYKYDTMFNPVENQDVSDD